MSETQLDRLEKKFDRFVDTCKASSPPCVRKSSSRSHSEIEIAEVRSELAEVRSDIADLRAEIADVRAEMRTMRSEFQEKFENLSDRLRLVESRLAVLALEQSTIRQVIDHGLNELRAETERLRLKVEAIEAATLDNTGESSDARYDSLLVGHCNFPGVNPSAVKYLPDASICKPAPVSHPARCARLRVQPSPWAV